MLGSNDVDEFFGYSMRVMLDKGSAWYNRTIHVDMNIWHNTIAPHIIRFFRTLKDKAPDANIAYVKIILCNWWSDLGKELAQ